MDLRPLLLISTIWLELIKTMKDPRAQDFSELGRETCELLVREEWRETVDVYVRRAVNARLVSLSIKRLHDLTNLFGLYRGSGLVLATGAEGANKPCRQQRLQNEAEARAHRVV